MKKLLVLFLLLFAVIISSAQTTTMDNKGFHQELSKKSGPIHFLWDELLKKHVTEQGDVDYKSFKKDHGKLLGYISILSKVSVDDHFQTLSKEDHLAFWINAYNALTVDLIIRNYPIESIKDINNPWKQRLWEFGKNNYNLDEIEHEILRNMNEPRIHFAIVCASYSCPKLQNEAFTAEKLDQQLTKATKEFLADTNRNEISENSIKISKIFDWFSKDFTKNGSLIDFLNLYTEVNISPNAKKRYKDYNWALND
jgi:hypothetical protein